MSSATRSGGGSSSCSPTGELTSGALDRRRPGRVRDLAAGRLAAPQGPARERLRDASGPMASGGCTPSTRHRSRRWTCGSTSSAASGSSVSTRSPPSSRAASANGASRRDAPTSRRRTQSMIDIVREIEAVQREVGQRPDRGGEGANGPPRTHLRRADRGRLGRPDRPGADRPLVPADQRRLPRRRAIPVRGQRRRRDPRLRATESAARDLGLRRGHQPGGRLRARGAARRRPGTESTTLVLEHTAIVPDEMWAQFGPGAVGVGWDGGLLGLSLHLRGGSIGDPIGLAAVRRGTRVLRAEQRGVGRRERGCRRGPGGRRERRREHHRVLRTGPRGARPEVQRPSRSIGQAPGSYPSVPPSLRVTVRPPFART